MGKQGSNPELFILTAVRLPAPYIAELKLIKKRDHRSISEQIRQAIRGYLKEQAHGQK